MLLRRTWPSACLAAILLIASRAIVLRAQHSDRPPEIVEGESLYKTNCILCHGASGASVPGIDLRAGKFRRATSDADLIKTIREGISGSGMPPNKVTPVQAANILQYLRASLNAEVSEGALAAGQRIFEGKGGCAGCHSIGGKGAASGPWLDEVGGIHSRAEIEKSLLDPNADVAPEFRRFRGTLKSGARIEGKPLIEDTFAVQLLDTSGKLVSVQKSDLRDYTFSNDSPMPSVRGLLDASEVSALLDYLCSLTAL